MEALDETSLAEDEPRYWWIFLVNGILWILFAFLVLSFTFTTVWAVALFFGFGFIIGGIFELMVSSRDTSWRWLHVTFGVIAIIAGILALIWPGETFLVLAAIIGWYVMIAGTIDIVVSVTTRRINDLWWLGLILGIVEVLIGFWAVGYSGRSIALLVVWVGATALVRGIANLMAAFGLHRIGKTMRGAMA